jgi:hypothetical protein
MQTHENVMLSGTRQSGRKITISNGCFSSCGRVGPPPWGTVWTVLLSVKWCEPWRDQRFGGLEIWGWFPEFPVTMSQWGRNKLSRCTWFSLCYTLPYIYILEKVTENWRMRSKTDGFTGLVYPSTQVSKCIQAAGCWTTLSRCQHFN